ncbi:uncharacterized protein EDB91DRAFT_1088186 [Suillus paluster]|uniref:uncharacterized protein n=1 Tax=Suillus paluster TaxID=48578 RepID=UPI001B85D467|nr:uncharacterized protein EDB91DRAFT_1088186 [Suillus paluster]KAG1722330.1 hypothetical protein EDB91DRAFT_1088186 [Suillus paluster]
MSDVNQPIISSLQSDDCEILGKCYLQIHTLKVTLQIIALGKCEFTIVQSSCILVLHFEVSWTLPPVLVLGMCFFAGGMRFSEQALQGQPSYSDLSMDCIILKTSHGVVIILLFIDGPYLGFQLFTHTALYDDNNANPRAVRNIIRGLRSRPYRCRNGRPVPSPDPTGREAAINPFGPAEGTDLEHGAPSAEDTDSEIEPYTSVAVSLRILVVVTALVMQRNTLLKLQCPSSLSLGVAVGSSILTVLKQIALFVIPFIMLGWIIGKPPTLLFDPFESVVLFLSGASLFPRGGMMIKEIQPVLGVNHVVQDEPGAPLGREGQD